MGFNSGFKGLMSKIKTPEACTIFAAPHHRIKEATSRHTAKHYDCHSQPSSTQDHQFPTNGSPNPAAMFLSHPPTQLPTLNSFFLFCPFSNLRIFSLLNSLPQKALPCIRLFLFPVFSLPIPNPFSLASATPPSQFHFLKITTPQPQKILFLNCKLFQLQYKDSSSKVDRPIRTSYEMNKQMDRKKNCLHIK